MGLLLILLAIVAVLVIAVWLYFRGKNPPPIDRSRTTRTSFPETTLPGTVPASQVPDEESSNPLDNVREPVRAGIKRLFSPEETDAAKPMAYGDVDRQILDKVGEQIESIKNFRSTHQRLQKILNDPALNVTSALSSTIMADPVLSAKILKIVNSAYYGRGQKVNSIGHALFLLGMVHLREIIYREGMLELLKVNDPEKDRLIDVFWRHATITSVCASHLRSLFPDLDQGTLFTAGLIHDVGKVILVRMDGHAEYTTQSTIHDEDRIFGVNHAIVGRMALEKWGFSELMVTAISNHHMPSYVPLQTLKLSQQVPQYLMVLFLANQLAKMIHPEPNYLPVNPLHSSYHPFIDEEAFTRAALDGFLLTQIGKSEAFVS